MVRVAGLEPARAEAQQILSLWCLPIPPYPHIIKAQIFMWTRTTKAVFQKLLFYPFYNCCKSLIFYKYYIIFFLFFQIKNLFS